MNAQNILLLLLSSMAGALFFGWYVGWVVVYFPMTTQKHYTPVCVRHKEVSYYYPESREQKKEKANLVWGEDEALNISYLLKSWCTLMHEEGVLKNTVTTQTVLLCDRYAYISLDRPLVLEESTREKIVILHAFLQTIAMNTNLISHVIFLIDHKPWLDERLDFSNPWPVRGFV